jgi:hypothetical protein
MLQLNSAIANEFGLFGQFSGNYYAAPVQRLAKTHSNVTGDNAYDLSGWRAFLGQDMDSRSSVASTMRLEHNPSVAPKQVALDSSYVDPTGAARSGTLTLQPFTSIVLMK